jgi:hypothetical protein
MLIRKLLDGKLSISLHASIVVLLLKATATRTANIAPAPAMASQRRRVMSKEQAIIHCRTAMSVFKKWLDAGIITEEELSKIETIIAKKYGLSPCSIYR